MSAEDYEDLTCPFRVAAYPSEPAKQICIQDECELWISEEQGCTFWVIAQKGLQDNHLTELFIKTQVLKELENQLRDQRQRHEEDFRKTTLQHMMSEEASA